jgi:hypothetical protein
VDAGFDVASAAFWIIPPQGFSHDQTAHAFGPALTGCGRFDAHAGCACDSEF